MSYLFIVLVLTLATSIYINFLFIENMVNYSEVMNLNKDDAADIENATRASHDESFRETSDDESRSEIVKVAIFDGNAYWVGEQGLTVAPIGDDDEVAYLLQEPVNVLAMTQNEIDTLLEILDALEGSDDESNGAGEQDI